MDADDEEVIFENRVLHKALCEMGVEDVATERVQEWNDSHGGIHGQDSKGRDGGDTQVQPQQHHHSIPTDFCTRLFLSQQDVSSIYNRVQIRTRDRLKASPLLSSDDKHFLESYMSDMSDGSDHKAPGSLQQQQSSSLLSFVYVCGWITMVVGLLYASILCLCVVVESEYVPDLMYLVRFDPAYFYGMNALLGVVLLHWAGKVWLRRKLCNKIEKMDCVVREFEASAQRLSRVQRKCVKRIAEAEFAGRGFTLARLSSTSCSDIPMVTQIDETCPTFRSALLRGNVEVVSRLEHSYKLLTDSVPLEADFKWLDVKPPSVTPPNESHDLGKGDNSSNSDVKDRPVISTTMLTSSHELLKFHLSTYVRRLVLSFAPYYNSNDCVVPNPYVAVCQAVQGCVQSMDQTACLLEKQYSFYRAVYKSEERTASSSQRSMDEKPVKRPVESLFVCVNSLDLHLQTISTISRDLTLLLEGLVEGENECDERSPRGDDQDPNPSVDHYHRRGIIGDEDRAAWMQTLQEIKAGLGACKTCYEEAVKVLALPDKKAPSPSASTPETNTSPTEGETVEKPVVVIPDADPVIEDQMFEVMTGPDGEQAKSSQRRMYSAEAQAQARERRDVHCALWRELKTVVDHRAVDTRKREERALARARGQQLSADAGGGGDDDVVVPLNVNGVGKEGGGGEERGLNGVSKEGKGKGVEERRGGGEEEVNGMQNGSSTSAAATAVPLERNGVGEERGKEGGVKRVRKEGRRRVRGRRGVNGVQNGSVSAEIDCEEAKCVASLVELAHQAIPPPPPSSSSATGDVGSVLKEDGGKEKDAMRQENKNESLGGSPPDDDNIKNRHHDFNNSGETVSLLAAKLDSDESGLDPAELPWGPLLRAGLHTAGSSCAGGGPGAADRGSTNTIEKTGKKKNKSSSSLSQQLPYDENWRSSIEKTKARHWEMCERIIQENKEEAGRGGGGEGEEDGEREGKIERVVPCSGSIGNHQDETGAVILNGDRGGGAGGGCHDIMDTSSSFVNISSDDLLFYPLDTDINTNNTNATAATTIGDHHRHFPLEPHVLVVKRQQDSNLATTTATTAPSSSCSSNSQIICPKSVNPEEEGFRRLSNNNTNNDDMDDDRSSAYASRHHFTASGRGIVLERALKEIKKREVDDDDDDDDDDDKVVHPNRRRHRAGGPTEDLNSSQWVNISHVEFVSCNGNQYELFRQKDVSVEEMAHRPPIPSPDPASSLNTSLARMAVARSRLFNLGVEEEFVADGECDDGVDDDHDVGHDDDDGHGDDDGSHGDGDADAVEARGSKMENVDGDNDDKNDGGETRARRRKVEKGDHDDDNDDDDDDDDDEDDDKYRQALISVARMRKAERRGDRSGESSTVTDICNSSISSTQD